MRRMGWYAGWAVVVVVLIALPAVVYATRDHTSSTADPLAPSPTPTPTPSPTTVAATGDEPLCANVWQQGKTLPADYPGCQASGKLTKVAYLDAHRCVVGYDGRFLATPGGKVWPQTKHWRTSKAYVQSLAACTS